MPGSAGFLDTFSLLQQSSERGLTFERYFRRVSTHRGGDSMAAGTSQSKSMGEGGSWSLYGGLLGSKELRPEPETGITIKDQP